MKGKQQMIIYSKFTEWLNSCPVYYVVQSSEEYIEDNNSMSILFDIEWGKKNI